MGIFQNTVFFDTIAQLEKLPLEVIAEVAFAGRSNAGKSSAINALANHTRLAFTSKMPGRTQHLNFFRVADEKYFVDLPGYGFAKAPGEVREAWEGLLAPYLRERVPLAGLVIIMDIRHPMTELDLQMINWFAVTQKPIHILLSKADKCSRNEQAQALFAVKKALADLGDQCSAQVFSSTHRLGIAEAEETIAGWLAMPWEPEKTPPAKPRTEKTARIKNRKAKGFSARTAAKKG